MKQLITNINPTVSNSECEQWIKDITNAAKKFPDFANTGNEYKDREEFAAFLTIVGAETSYSSANGFPCTKENGCPDCEACSYNSKGKQCEKN